MDRATLLAALETLRTFFHAPAVDRARRIDGEPLYFTSRGPLPPGVSRRRFNEIAKNVPESRKDGRAWVVPAKAWAQHRDTGKRGLIEGRALGAPASAWTAQNALQRVGIVDSHDTGRIQ